MMQVERQQLRFEERERRAARDAVETELSQADAAHFHLVAKHGYGVVAVVPKVGERIGCAKRARVLISQIEHAVCDAVFDDAFKLRRFVRTGRKLCISVSDRKLVVSADAARVSIREIEFAILNFDERRRIVHDRSTAGVSRSGEVMFESESVRELVAG